MFKLTIMLEKEKGTGKYEHAKDNMWPKNEEYVINMYKTYCEKGSVLRWNNETKRINATVKGTDKCYVYFDLSEYGDEEHPYLIQTIEDLVRLSNDVNGGTTYEGKYFLLTTDLDFQDEADYEDANRTDFKDINGINGDESLIKELTTGSGFKPIGKVSRNYFRGNFDGGNKKIDNLYVVDITNNSSGSQSNGLFSNIYKAVIKNLTVSGIVSTKYDTNMGGIIGVANDSIIANCHNKVNVTSTSGSWSTGGVLGTSYGTVKITNCTNIGNITGGAWIGGIVGGVGSGSILTITNCSNSGIISKNDNVYFVGIGGIIGGAISATEAENIIVKNSYNTGELKISTELSQRLPIGGLIGQTAAKTIINDSYNLGNIDATNVQYEAITGGLVGLSSNNLTIETSYNKGEIINAGGYYSGGLLGQDNNATSSTTISNSHNEGKITSNSKIEKDINLGGLVGKISGNINIDSSYNIGEIRDIRENYSQNLGVSIGGLIGILDSDGEEAKIISSYNTGNLYEGNRVGGIIGCISARKTKTIIDKCYNMGNMSTNTIAGSWITTTSGIIGYNAVSTSLILNSFNIGNISSQMVASGIAYEDQTGILYTINSYNTGNIIGNNYGSGLFTSTNNSTNIIYAYNLFNIGLIESSNKYGIFANRQSSTINAIKIAKNVYYENSVSASNVVEVEGIPKAINDMKSQTFVDELNKNVEDINLEEIDDSLKDYKVSKWTLSSGGYPTLVNE